MIMDFPLNVVMMLIYTVYCSSFDCGIIFIKQVLEYLPINKTKNYHSEMAITQRVCAREF